MYFTPSHLCFSFPLTSPHSHAPHSPSPLLRPFPSLTHTLSLCHSHTLIFLLPSFPFTPSLPPSLPPFLPLTLPHFFPHSLTASLTASLPPSLPHSLPPSFPPSLPPSLPLSLPPSVSPSLPPSLSLSLSSAFSYLKLRQAQVCVFFLLQIYIKSVISPGIFY